MPVKKNVLENLPKELEEKLEKLTNNCEEQFDKTEHITPIEVTPTHHEVTSEPMPYKMKPVYFTIKELETLYRKHKITCELPLPKGRGFLFH